MLTSIALIILMGLSLAFIFDKLKLPRLIGMILTGIILGPYMLNVLDPTILNISSELRQIALVIILTRAGLALDIKDLKKVGRPAILMCFVPAVFEILGFIILGPKLLNLSFLDSAILGTVIAAVSPAIIVPRMIKLMDEGYGTKKSIPQLILAGASVDDIFVIVLFTSLTSLAKSESSFSLNVLLQIPISIILGVLIGIVIGLILIKLFKVIHTRDSNKLLIILSISFLFITLENSLKEYIPISGLLAVMSLGATIYKSNNDLSIRLSSKYSKLWAGAEIFLFVLVGATVNINYALRLGLVSVIIIIFALLFRILGVYLSLIKTNLNKKERFFTSLSYLPKATVQAAIGALPLSMGLSSGETILTVAVVSILVTAPLGAILIDNTYKKLLK
ncbi:sodium:proton antiporter [Clostridium sartagoforme]|uniref:Sodium:proton antiporter n=1 Tax=Clostridium sartagoforme TaxID=84031 RepID=A0A4S2DNS2_9CLOT|nr:cation:proton antiporter [Clostridium sartagoforme]TGY44009.1 sodium:proton antiporter [Clostridium sartagoforme]